MCHITTAVLRAAVNQFEWGELLTKTLTFLTLIQPLSRSPLRLFFSTLFPQPSSSTRTVVEHSPKLCPCLDSSAAAQISHVFKGTDIHCPHKTVVKVCSSQKECNDRSRPELPHWAGRRFRVTKPDATFTSTHPNLSLPLSFTLIRHFPHNLELMSVELLSWSWRGFNNTTSKVSLVCVEFGVLAWINGYVN